MKVSVKWAGKKFDQIELDVTQPAVLFKAQLFALTGVDPERQKILIKGGTMKDDTDLSQLGLNASAQVEKILSYPSNTSMSATTVR
ncbi:ubiquitin-specific protease ubp7 [Chytriomyces hyalinus]|nr:ubiquitin-specific protease ubp7 [Chytriomyces hyalinus]